MFIAFIIVIFVWRFATPFLELYIIPALILYFKIAYYYFLKPLFLFPKTFILDLKAPILDLKTLNLNYIIPVYVL